MQKTDRELKEFLYNHCSIFIEERLAKVQKQIKEINLSLDSETKSSAGDKHETGRAMIQLEREKAGQQWAEVEKLKEAFAKIDITKCSDSVTNGSVVMTSSLNYFIAISAGELKVDSQRYYAISPNTPIALLLLGKTSGDEISFRDQRFVIKRIF